MTEHRAPAVATANALIQSFQQVIHARGDVTLALLFGSRARGDHRPDSDYDVAVFIRGAGSFFEENRRLAAITTEISLEMESDISAIPFPAEAYRERTGFMHELRVDGIEI